VTEVTDDAPGIVHPGRAGKRGVVHDPVSEGRGGLVQTPGGPPRPRIAVSGTFQPAGEEVGGTGDRQGRPRSQGPGETPDADVEPDLGPVIPGRLPDRREQLPRGPADPGHPLPFRGVAVPPGAGLGLRGGLVQQPAGVRPVRPGSCGPVLAAGCGQAQDIPHAGEGGPDIAEVAARGGGPVLGRSGRRAGRPRSIGECGGRAGAVTVAGGTRQVEGMTQDRERGADIGEGGAVGAGRGCRRAPAFGDRGQDVVQFV
jgi:hypothetical protein